MDDQGSVKKLQTPPTREWIEKNGENLEYGGTDRGGKASLRIMYQCPFDIMDEAGAFNRDFRGTVSRFHTAHLSHCHSLGAHFGGITDSSGDAATGMPLQQLYRLLIQAFAGPRRQKQFGHLKELISELRSPSGGPPDIAAYKRYLLPLRDLYESALVELESVMEKIGKDYEDREEAAAALAQREADYRRGSSSLAPA